VSKKRLLLSSYFFHAHLKSGDYDFSIRTFISNSLQTIWK